jgi:hypothetical protein
MLDKDQLALLDNKALRRLIPVLFPVWEVGGYDKKVMATNPIAYWPLSELSGSTARCLVNSAQNGTYTGVTLGQAITDSNGVRFICPLFDGANDYADVYSATLNSAFNGDEGSLALWARVYNVGVWTDGTYRAMFMLSDNSNQNRVRPRRSTTDNRINGSYEAGDVSEDTKWNIGPSVDWVPYGMSWSASGDIVRFYGNGVEQDTSSTLGTWVQNFHQNKCCIGAATKTPTSVWYGWVAKVAVWDSVKPPAHFVKLAKA